LSDWGAKARDTEELLAFETLLSKYGDMTVAQFSALVEERPLPELKRKPSDNKQSSEIAQKYIDRFRSEASLGAETISDLKSDAAANVSVLKLIATELLGAAADLKTKPRLLAAIDGWVRRQASREQRPSNVEGGL
jgi:hypothetical protein